MEIVGADLHPYFGSFRAGPQPAARAALVQGPGGSKEPAPVRLSWRSSEAGVIRSRAQGRGGVQRGQSWRVGRSAKSERARPGREAAGRGGAVSR